MTNKTYNNGENLIRLHPDEKINNEVTIQMLCNALDVCRSTLLRLANTDIPLDPVSAKILINWTLKETEPSNE